MPEEYYEIPIGQANVAREGDDITLVSYGYGITILHEAADILKQQHNISAEIIDIRSLHPIDYDTIIASVQKSGRAVMLDTARRLGGIMPEIVSETQQRVIEWLDGPIMRVGAKDVPWPYNRTLEQDMLPDANDVIEATHQIMTF